MGIKLIRKKPWRFLISLKYKIYRLPFWRKSKKFSMLLDREWIYSRLAWEQSFQIYEFHEHPLRKAFVQFAQKYIKADYCVLDLGCKYGEMTNLIAGFGTRVIESEFRFGNQKYWCERKEMEK